MIVIIPSVYSYSFYLKEAILYSQSGKLGKCFTKQQESSIIPFFLLEQLTKSRKCIFLNPNGVAWLYLNNLKQNGILQYLSSDFFKCLIHQEIQDSPLPCVIQGERECGVSTTLRKLIPLLLHTRSTFIISLWCNHKRKWACYSFLKEPGIFALYVAYIITCHKRNFKSRPSTKFYSPPRQFPSIALLYDPLEINFFFE